MSNDTLMQTILENLDSTIATLKTKNGARDCLDECGEAYDKCMSVAGSDLEKAACKSIYTKCVANC